MNKKTGIESLEITLLLEALYQHYGYDFKNYAKASLKRRIQNVLKKTDAQHISDLIPKTLHNTETLNLLLGELSVTVTEMFRDPPFFLTLRQKLFSYLKTYPFIKIWCAGCATGQEVYSLAIFLKEENLYDKATIFATDFNDEALQIAREGIYSIQDIPLFTGNYQKAGGKKSFSDYYHAKYQSVIFDKALRQNITFANHNLAVDKSFGEMHLILCRNVLIYFDRTLQDRVFNLFDESLVHGGFLALGTRESNQFSNAVKPYKTIQKECKIYQKPYDKK